MLEQSCYIEEPWSRAIIYCFYGDFVILFGSQLPGSLSIGAVMLTWIVVGSSAMGLVSFRVQELVGFQFLS